MTRVYCFLSYWANVRLLANTGTVHLSHSWERKEEEGELLSVEHYPNKFYGNFASIAIDLNDSRNTVLFIYAYSLACSRK